MWICAAVILIGFLPALLVHKVAEFQVPGVPRDVVFWWGLGIAFAGMAIVFVIWRCPECKSHLGANAKLTNCPRCGTRFV